MSTRFLFYRNFAFIINELTSTLHIINEITKIVFTETAYFYTYTYVYAHVGIKDQLCSFCNRGRGFLIYIEQHARL